MLLDEGSNKLKAGGSYRGSCRARYLPTFTDSASTSVKLEPRSDPAITGITAMGTH